MPAPFSTRQIALLFKDLVHYVLGASGTAFTNNFRWSAFLSRFTPTRISKVHASWWLKQTRNFKDFLHILYKSCFFQFWRDTDLENNFFWGQVTSIFTPFSHRQLFISVRCQTTYQTDVMNNFFLTNIIQKELNLLHTEQVHSWLRPSLLLVLWAFYRASVLTHAVDLWQVQPVHKFTNTFWPWRNSLKLHVFFDSGRRLSSLNFSSTVYCLPTSFCEFWHV